MAKKRKLEQLRPEDFPGVDPVKFSRWRSAATKYEPIAWAAYIVIAIVFPGAFLITRPLPDLPVYVRVPGFAVVMFGVLLATILLITKEPRRLATDAGITPEAIKSARARPRAAHAAEGDPQKSQPAPTPAAVTGSATTAVADLATASAPVAAPATASAPSTVASPVAPQITPSGAPPAQGTFIEIPQVTMPPPEESTPKRCAGCGAANKADASECWSCSTPL